MVITPPSLPDAGDKLAITGAGMTVNDTPLLVPPAVVTVMLPLVAAFGTATVTPVEDQAVGVATAPLMETVLEP